MKMTEQHMEKSFDRLEELNYLLYLPENMSSEPLPLLLFLHGMGERGSDLSLVKKHGPPKEIEKGAELPFIVVAPQCHEDTVWQPDSLLALVDYVQSQYNVDRTRIYVTGLSMGGYGTWLLASLCPELFAAIAPVCGPFTMIEPRRFTNIPVWCFHGAMDDVVPVNDSLRMVQWIRESGGDVRLTVYPDADHDSWSQTYADKELYDWLLSHRRA